MDTPGVVARESRIARVAKALAVVYVPSLLPFVAGPLRECDHCVATYAKLLPLVPGAFAGLISNSVLPRSDVSMGVAAGVGACLVLLIVFRCLSLEKFMRAVILGGIAILLAAQAMAFSLVLRA